MVIVWVSVKHVHPWTMQIAAGQREKIGAAMKPGIYAGMPRDQYDAIQAVNISLLIHGLRSMNRVRHVKEHGSKDTAALCFGRAVHLAVYEPAEFEKQVVAKPYFTGDGARKKTAAFMSENAEKLIVSPGDYEDCCSLRDSLHSSPITRGFLEAPGQGECSFVWRDEKTGLLCKGRLDRFCSWMGYSICNDLKTCQDARPWAFARDVYKHGYHIKAAWYLAGLNALAPCERRFIWLAVESEPPHDHMMHEPDDFAMTEGNAAWRRLLDQYAKCMQSGQWPGYATGIEPLALPRYAQTEASIGSYEA